MLSDAKAVSRSFIAVFSVTAAIAWFLLRSFTPHALPTLTAGGVDQDTKAHHNFWRELQKLTADGQPSFPEVERKNPGWPFVFYDPGNPNLVRPDRLNISTQQFNELASTRAKAIKDIERLAPKLPFVKDSRGIVSSAHNLAFPIQAVSLWMLRRAGSKLPFELWVSNQQQYEELACTEIFLPLQARCRIMSDYYPSDLPQLYPDGFMGRFTFKIMALIMSSFDDVLWLDNDVFPVLNPDMLFDLEPYKTSRYVLWPDLWIHTGSEHWFRMANRPVPDLKERPSSESGQMMFSKSTHAKALLMTYFYNFHGPNYWYRLFSQGATGEGDKETFIPAAEDFGLPWHQVATLPHLVGYQCQNWERVAFGHAHPLDDERQRPSSRLLFFHHNQPKLDVQSILVYNESIGMGAKTFFKCDENGPFHRIWSTDDPKIARLNALKGDVEREMWRYLRYLACNHSKSFNYWHLPNFMHARIIEDACQRLEDIWDGLFPGQTWIAPAL